MFVACCHLSWYWLTLRLLVDCFTAQGPEHIVAAIFKFEADMVHFSFSFPFTFRFSYHENILLVSKINTRNLIDRNSDCSAELRIRYLTTWSQRRKCRLSFLALLLIRFGVAVSFTSFGTLLFAIINACHEVRLLLRTISLHVWLLVYAILVGQLGFGRSFIIKFPR